MKAEIRFLSSAATIALADASSGVRAQDLAEGKSLRGRAKAGEAFIAETGGPRLVRIVLDEPVPPEIEETRSARCGPYLLRVPSGRLTACVLATESPTAGEPPETQTLDVPPGDYALSVFDDSSPDVTARTAGLDDADWRIYERVNHFGALGCLSLAMGMLFVLIPYTRHEYWFLLPLFLLPTGAFIFLRRLPGYSRVSERVREHQADAPQVVISMTRVESTEGLEGGWYRFA